MPGGWVGLAWRPGAGTPSTAGELRVAHDVFISYSSSDWNIANAVCARLEANGVRCWIAPRDILPGTSWGGAIIRALSEARVMVLLFSLKANKSPQILREVERAVGRGVVIVPVRIEDVQPQDDFEYFLSSQHWLDILTHPLEEHLDKLCVVVKQVLAAPSSAGETGATKEVREAVPVAEPVGIPPPPQSQPAQKRKSSRFWVGGLAAAVVLLVVIGGTMWLNRGGSSASEATADALEGAGDPFGSVPEPPPAQTAVGPDATASSAALPDQSRPGTEANLNRGGDALAQGAVVGDVSDADPPSRQAASQSPAVEATSPGLARRESAPVSTVAADRESSAGTRREAEEPVDPEASAAAPATGVVVMVRGDPRDAQRTERTILRSMLRTGDLQAFDPSALQLLGSDPSVLERALVGDVGALAALASQYAAKYMVVGDLSAEAQPSVRRFFSGSARLDVTMYQVSTGLMLETETFVVGSGGVPGKAGTTEEGARADAVDDVGARAARAIRMNLAGGGK